MRKITAWIIFFVFALWGPLEAFPRALAPATPAMQTAAVSQTIAATPAHSPNCRCMQCTGGPTCCCRPTHSATDAAKLLARCDQPTEKSLAGKVKPHVLLCTADAPIFLPAITIRFTAHTDALRSRAATPLELPPAFV